MYSVVLWMALSGAGEIPVSAGGSGCCGCTGGRVYVVSCAPQCDCAAECLAPCGCHGGRPGFVRRFFSFERFGNGCHGCHGCHGGSYVGSAAAHFSGEEIDGGPQLKPEAAPGHLLPGPTPRKGERIGPPKDSDGPKNGDGIKEAALLSGKAVIVVTLPAEATLTVDGRPSEQTSARREFTSPELPMGKEFTYTFRAQLDRGGEILTVSKRVKVRAGQQTQIELVFPGVSVVQR